MTALANSSLSSEDTYGKMQGTEDHGVIIFPLRILSGIADMYKHSDRPITESVPEEIIMYPMEGTDNRHLRSLNLVVRKSKLSEIIKVYFNKRRIDIFCRDAS